ncbi:MAG: ATP-grasp domain-containing protein, partial [Spirochaetales bacterium]
MKLYEYQAKNLFSSAGIPIPKGECTDSLERAREIASNLGYPLVVKAQVLQGGRGKAGLIRNVDVGEDLDRVVQELFQSPHRVHRILLEQAIRFEKEYYLSFTMDPKEAKALLI